MTRLMFALTAAALFGPLAAHAAIKPPPEPAANAATDAAYQTARLNGGVLALTDEVRKLQQQTAPGTAYVAELSGLIPTGG